MCSVVWMQSKRSKILLKLLVPIHVIRITIPRVWHQKRVNDSRESTKLVRFVYKQWCALHLDRIKFNPNRLSLCEMPIIMYIYLYCKVDGEALSGAMCARAWRKKSTWRIWIYYRVNRSEERETESEENRREEKKTYTNLKYIFWIRYTFWHVMFRPDINWSESTICKTKIMLKPSDSFCMSCISYLFAIPNIYLSVFSCIFVARMFSHEFVASIE